MEENRQRIRSVAVIGAGVSGVSSAAHLLKQGLDVTLFERSSIAGGVWHFDKRSAPDPDYSRQNPSLGDYERQFPAIQGYVTPPRTPPQDRLNAGGQISEQVSDSDKLEIAHAPPGPTYEGLKTNVSLPLMKTTLGDWPHGLDEYVNQRYVEKYIQEIARTSGVEQITKYRTRVEDIKKPSATAPWTVQTRTLNKSNDEYHFSGREWQFDAVVVASGHYNMPRIPDIPGLKEWKARFPDRVMHSKGYRMPLPFKDTVLFVIGAGASSTDIVKETTPIAKTVYQSSRGGVMDVPPHMLPEKAIRVGGVKAFHLDENTHDVDLGSQQSIPGYVELSNGDHLRVDNVILGSGYITSYPYLPHLHDDKKAAHEAGEQVLITKDGDMVHNLHKDIFWISDPTLAFVGVPYHISTFSLFDFQAQIVARVFSGLAQVPLQAEMREAYRSKLALRSLGRDFHSLRGEGEELGYVADLVAWANEDAKVTGAPIMLGHTETFLEGHRRQREMLQQLGLRLERAPRN